LPDTASRLLTDPFIWLAIVALLLGAGGLLRRLQGAIG
jgi:hypothetical protein